MKRMIGSLFLSMLVAGSCVAQSTQSQANGTGSQESSVSADRSGAQATSNASAAASQATAVADKNGHVQAAGTSQLEAGTTMQAQLTKPLDARKNKVGDEVTAKTIQDVKSNGRVVVPRGSKLIGHVTEATMHNKSQANSTLGIMFERAVLKNGSEIPVSLGIQAIGRAQAAAAASEDETMTSPSAPAVSSSGRASGGGLLSSAGSTAGRVVNTATSTAGGVANESGSLSKAAATGSLTSSSQGVVGLHGLSLTADTPNSTHASVITSNGGNVHLDSGTEMILRVNP